MAPSAKADSGSCSDARVARERAFLPLNFIYSWKLESLFSSSPKGEESWHHSPPFEAGGYRWKLALHPTCLRLEDGKSYWSLFLRLEDVVALSSHFIVETTLESSILNESRNKQGKRKVVYEFRKGRSEEECPSLISLETLNCPSMGFFTVEVSNVSVHAEEDEPSSQLDEKKTEYTWKIDGFSKLTNTSYKSSPFLIGGNIWNLILHPKGNHQDKYLSLYLELDKASGLPPSDNVHADFGLFIVDQIHGTSIEKQANSNFNSKATAWGYLCLISLDNLHDPSKGFLVNDTCIVKVVIYSCKE